MAEEKAETKTKQATAASGKIFAVIRIRGSFGVRWDVDTTLKQLRLTRKNHCVLLNDSPSTRGMLQKIKDYATWGEATPETVKALKEKRGGKAGKAGGEALVFRLSPARGGFKSIKQPFPRGALGYRGDKINALINSMI